MNYPYGLLPDNWYWLAGFIYLIVLAVVLKTSPWQRFKRPESIHIFMGSCVALLLLWHITTTTFPGLNYHYMGATLLVLMFGWQLAFLAFSLVFLGMTLDGNSDWQSMPLNILLGGGVPIMVSQIIFTLVDRYLPNHFMIYVFLNAFFGAALALLCMILCASLVLILGEVYSYEYLQKEYFPFIPLMLFPEAFITGMLVSIIVAMIPGWMSTFDDERYLKGK
ncbi:energy-coupling factor ABC transporter permease [Kaarinaea lacus]